MKIAIISLLLFTTLLCRPAFCGEIHDAAKRGDLEKVKALLKDNPNLVFSKDDDGMTPLHWAANKDVAQLLLTYKAEVNVRNNDGNTPLHWAVNLGTKDVVELLLANKAAVNAKNNHDLTPLHYAAAWGRKDVAELLLVHGADVNAKQNNGQTPLHRAAMAGSKDVAELLLVHGADVNARDKDDKTPLFYAVNFTIANRWNNSLVDLLQHPPAPMPTPFLMTICQFVTRHYISLFGIGIILIGLGWSVYRFGRVTK